MKFGRKSMTPVKVSAVMDSIAITLSFSRVMKASMAQAEGGSKQKQLKGRKKLRAIEQKELIKRCWMSVLKYLVREPIFERYTKPLIE